MVSKIKLLDMAKLTSGLTLTGGIDEDAKAIQVDDKIFVKHLDAYYPVIFEKDVVFRIVMMLKKSKMTHDERVCLHFLAADLGIEDIVEEELFKDGPCSY